MSIVDSVAVNRTQSAATEADELLAYRSLLQQAHETGKRIQAKMNHKFNDSNPQAIVWTELESRYGLTEGTGQTVFDMVNGSVGSIEGTMQNDQCVNLIDRLVVSAK